MAKAPKQLTTEELDEFEVRTYALLNRRGTRNPSAKGWRSYAVVFETPYLQLVSMGHQITVRVCDRRPRNPGGVLLYEQAWQKDKASSKIVHHYQKAKIALQHMRDLMVLDDLADV